MKNSAILCALTGALYGQIAPSSPPDAVFRATTKLVQLSVIAQDVKGAPVADLRRENFTIFDNGSPQEIRVFLSEPSAQSGKDAGKPALPLPPNTFTNRIAAPAGTRSGYSIILIDDLFTPSDPPGEEGTSYASVPILRALRSLPADDKVAILALRRPLKVICEFTSDRDLLERQFRKNWAPIPSTPPPPPKQVIPQAAPTRGNAEEEFERIQLLQRSSASDEALSVLADYLAGIPGRKNLMMLSTRFFISAKAAQKLAQANVAIYPIDLNGVKGGSKGDPEMLAAMTGGIAFNKRNDLDVAMHEAIEDGRVSYMLGYYRPGDGDDRIPHRIAIRVSRPGVTLRYRANSEAEPAPPKSDNPVAGLIQALNWPVDATSIALTAQANRKQNRLDLSVAIDATNLDLELRDGLWRGEAEIVARFMAADATQVGDVVSQTATFNLHPATYARVLETGIPYRTQLDIPAKAVELRLLVGNLATGKIGTLTVPLTQLTEAAK